MTLRQVMARQWQVPLFVVSVVGFALVLGFLRPKQEAPDFETEFTALDGVANQKRYTEFFGQVESLRQLAENEEQLGRVHLLAGKTRAAELRQRHELGLDASTNRSAPDNYESVLTDYRQALTRGQPAPESVEAADIYCDMALAYWGLDDAENAIVAFNKALSVKPDLDPAVVRSLVRVRLAARPANYLVDAMSGLESILSSSASSADDRSWAFVRKAEVLIAQGKEEQALEMLSGAGDEVRGSLYHNELEFLRGRALRRAGRIDEAELALRALLGRIADRGDVYAQTLLELGRINYQQYRDHDARRFYRLVTSSQMGKDWYAAGSLGLAECAAMQQRYDEARGCYQETVDLLKQGRTNRALSHERLQESLIAVQRKLNLLKEYELCMHFLAIEQQISSGDDIDAAGRFAQMYQHRATQLLGEAREFRQGRAPLELSDDDRQWLTHQETLVREYFNQAGDEYLRVAGLAEGDDELYGASLIRAAMSYDKAGDPEMSIRAWRRVVDEREGDADWPGAVFNLGQAHQAVGEYQLAIKYYEELGRKHPKSPAAFEAAVPLARCFLALEPPEVEKAEQLLRRVLQHPAVTPVAGHFRNAMFELGRLYYSNEKYARAISVLTEATELYPDDPELGKYLFLVGNAYRRSGLALEETLSRLAATDAAGREKISVDRQRYLKRARDYFEGAIQAYDNMDRAGGSELDKAYLRDSWLYWADCLFDLGWYREAVTRYELAALRYQLTPAALAAYVQIVNCQLKLGNLSEARSANERARLQLDQMSDADLSAGAIALNRKQWAGWFDWVGNAGLW